MANPNDARTEAATTREQSTAIFILKNWQKKFHLKVFILKICIVDSVICTDWVTVAVHVRRLFVHGLFICPVYYHIGNFCTWNKVSIIKPRFREERRGWRQQQTGLAVLCLEVVSANQRLDFAGRIWTRTRQQLNLRASKQSRSQQSN